jgi:hypothetical protein
MNSSYGRSKVSVARGVAASILCGWCAAVGASAQQKVPPPPKPADEGPSLEVTMKFIQDKLNALGAVSNMMYVHDEIAGTDKVYKFRYEVTQVVADSSMCRLNYQFSVKVDEGNPAITPHSVSLKEVADIVVLPLEQQYKKSAATGGHPELSYRIDPPVFALVVHPLKPEKWWHYFGFYDEDPANRVAKALVHAVELCGGGGKKEEPF